MSNQPPRASWRQLNQWQKALLPVFGVWLLFMSLNRLLIFRTAPTFVEGARWGDLAEIFWMGFRFDLLVLGFFLLPVVPLSWFCRRAGVRLVHLLFLYLALSWTVIVIMALVGHGFFYAEGRHLSWWDLQSLLDGGSSASGHGTFYLSMWGLLSIVIYTLQLLIGLRELERARRRVISLRKMSPMMGEGFFEAALRAWGPLLLVGLAARGTVTPHHLEKSHSLITSSASLNQLVLNPVWAFDKIPDAP